MEQATKEQIAKTLAALPDEDKAALLAATTEQLDEMVHELKSQEAADINNKGRDWQIAYLLGLTI